jgi:hypothetical protein
MMSHAVLAAALLAASGPAQSEPSHDIQDGANGAPLLPRDFDVWPSTHWVVGLALETARHRIDQDELVRDLLAGLSVTFRYRAWGPHARLLLEPGGERYNEIRYFGAAGLRGYMPLAGTELSYGVGVHFDARLAHHYWLAGATPLELGATLYRAGTWRIELFAGARYAFAGALVDSFLIDPNGFDNADAHEDLQNARDEQPWEVYLTLTFGRRID